MKAEGGPASTRGKRMWLQGLSVGQVRTYTVMEKGIS